MSNLDQCVIDVRSKERMQDLGISMLRTLYKKPITLGLKGELGAGKTTLTQGIAKGLGIGEHAVTSPSFALEARHQSLTHIDLYRLNEKQARDILMQSDDHEHIRVVEWADRTNATHDIDIHIVHRYEDTSHPDRRRVTIVFRDCALPDDRTIDAWRKDAHTPMHICRHMDVVASVAEICADAAISCGIPVRRTLLRAAAKAHDLLRTIDIPKDIIATWKHCTDVDTTRWNELRQVYNNGHEMAGAAYVTAAGYPEVGSVIQTHKGECFNDAEATTEMLLLAYSDKRVSFESIVSVRERFNDLAKRHQNGVMPTSMQKRMEEVLAFERTFFGTDPLHGLKVSTTQ